MSALVTRKHHRCPVMLAIYLLLNLLNSALAQLVSSVQMSPSYLDALPDNQQQIVNVTFRLEFASESALSKHGGSLDQELTNYQVQCAIDDTRNAEVEQNATSCLPAQPANYTSQYDGIASENARYPVFECSAQVGVQGKFIGKTSMRCWVINSDEDSKQLFDDDWDQQNGSHSTGLMLTDSYPVWVLQSSHHLNTIFVSTLIVLCMIANVMMGCDLNMEIVKNTLTKPLAPAIGFVCQFVIMPLVSYTIARSILFPAGLYTLGLGLFTTGCAPGGGASNFWTLLMRGNTDLSITMTFLSTILALVMMPVWMLCLGDHFLVDHPDVNIRIPYANICASLTSLALPLLIGILIRKFKRDWADGARKVLRPFVIFVLVFIITFGSYANFYMFYLMSSRVLIAGLLLPWCGFMFGCFVSLLMRQDPRDVSAIAIETGIQNTGVAIMLLKVSFRQPDADLASVLPVVSSIFTPVPLLTAWLIHKWAEKVYGKKKQPGQDAEAGALPEKKASAALAAGNGVVVVTDGHDSDGTELKTMANGRFTSKEDEIAATTPMLTNGHHRVAVEDGDNVA